LPALAMDKERADEKLGIGRRFQLLKDFPA
jgi:hypothetical protein